MELYKSLQDALIPSLPKKRIGTLMSFLALLILFVRFVIVGFRPDVDLLLSIFLFFVGILLFLLGRGYRFFVKMYIAIHQEGFEIKVDRQVYQVAWKAVVSICFLSEELHVVLKDKRQLTIALSHLNPNCIKYLKEVFSEATWDAQIPISFE